MTHLQEVELQVEITENNFVPLDLDRSTTFALNYYASDLSNPTVTKIPYSAQITLPKTKTNNNIFANIGIRSTIELFKPGSRLNFRLFIHNNIFQIGYIELEGVDIEEEGFYRIRLYGGLGDYFHYLSQLRLDQLEIECDHPINTKELKNLLENDDKPYGYAITYQGKYDKFDENQTHNPDGIEKATWTKTVTYTNTDLDEHKRNENEYSGEYRSYYQKPTIRFKTLIEEIKKKSEEQGYKIIFDKNFFDEKEENPYYHDLWLLCNNYEVGDMVGGLSFSVKEFGDENSKIVQEDWIKIKENQAKRLGNNNKEEEIPCEDFISSDRSSSIDYPVLITDAIKLNAGQTIDVDLFMRIIATSYDDKVHDQRYRYKENNLEIQVNIINAATGVIISSHYPPAATTSPYGREVSSRIFNRDNLNIKRPLDRKGGFGLRKNFVYDRPLNNDGVTQDSKTQWRFKQTYTTKDDIDVRVVFYMKGNTWWRPNKESKWKKYGVAFQILDNSLLKVSEVETTDDKRSDSRKTFKDIIGSEYTCYDLLMSYCKLFGLLFKVDNSTNEIHILLRDNYYTDTILDWNKKIDKNREFNLEPSAINFQKGIFKYNPLNTKYEEIYKNVYGEKNSPEYGSYTLITGYEVGNETYNYLDGTIFDNCIIATDYSPYFARRTTTALKDNKELPHLQTTSGDKVDMKGYIPLFREGTHTLDIPCRLTDDTELMQSQGIVCWNNTEKAKETSYILPRYVRTICRGDQIYSLNFDKPGSSYSTSEDQQTYSSGIYPRFWKSYLNDRLDPNCKILTCYVALTPSDLQGDLLSKFIYIEDTLWVIHAIKEFNPLSPEPTKVSLIKVKDINNYLDHSNISESFIITRDSEPIYDSSSGENPKQIVLNEGETSFTLQITSTLPWKATSTLYTDPQEGGTEPTDIQITLPETSSFGEVQFIYGNDSVTLTVIREIRATVTATTENGISATINGLPSPQEIVTGNTATFNATGNNTFLYWVINGNTYTNRIVTLTITGATTATAYFLASDQIMLYCDDPYTTITGQTKTENYWILTLHRSYTFNNPQPNFSGFFFSGDTMYRPTGSKTIEEKNHSLTAYYDRVLINGTVINNSPYYEFDDSNIFIVPADEDEDPEEIGFDECPPLETITFTTETETGSEITTERYDYHYPLLSNYDFSTTGIKTLTITAHRVGWDGDKTLILEEGGAITLQQMVYGPIEYTLTSEDEITATPDSGESDQLIEIETGIEGGTQTLHQHIGDFTYTLTLEKPEITPIGWLGDGTIDLEVEVGCDDEEYETIFYHNGLEIETEDELEFGEAQINEDNSQHYEVKATFEPNIENFPVTKTFTILCNGNTYTLTIIQEASYLKPIGWLGDGTVELNVTVEKDDTEYETLFYNKSFEVDPSDGLELGEEQEEADGSTYYEVKATFEPNTELYPVTKTFTIICRGGTYILNITQGAGDLQEGNYWGQAPDEDGVVTGSLTGADGLTPSESCLFDLGTEDKMYRDAYFCGDIVANSVTAESFNGNATSADKVNNNLTIINSSGTTTGTYNGSSATTISIVSASDIANAWTETTTGFFTNNTGSTSYTIIITLYYNNILRLWRLEFDFPAAFMNHNTSIATNLLTDNNNSIAVNAWWTNVKNIIGSRNVRQVINLSGAMDYNEHDRTLMMQVDEHSIYIRGEAASGGYNSFPNQSSFIYSYSGNY